MKRNLFYLLLLLVFTSTLLGQTLTEEWAVTFQDQLFNKVVGIAVDAAGNIYVSAYPYTSNSEGIIRSFGFTTIKYGPDGRQLWLARYPSVSEQFNQPSSMKIDSSGDVYVTGTTDRGYTTIKYDTNGKQLWIAKYPAFAWAKALALDNYGQVYVTGFCTGDSGSDFDIATIKYDRDGNQLWAAKFNYPLGYPSPDDRGFAIAVDEFGDVFATGSSRSSVIPPQGTADYDYQDTVTIKYDRDGNQLWSYRYEKVSDSPSDSSDVTYPTSIAINFRNEIYVINRAGDGRCVTVKYDNTGTQIWDKYTCPGFSYSNCNQCNSITVDTDGNLYARGDVENIGDGTRAELIEKYDGLDGTRLWYKSSVSFGEMYVDPDGNLYIPNGNVWEKYDTTGLVTESGPYNRQTNLYGSVGPVVDLSGNWYYSGNNFVGGHLTTIKLALISEGIITQETETGNGGGGGGCFITASSQ